VDHKENLRDWLKIQPIIEMSHQHLLIQLLPYCDIITLSTLTRTSTKVKESVLGYLLKMDQMDQFFTMLREITQCELYQSSQLSFLQVSKIRKLEPLFSKTATREEKLNAIFPIVALLQKLYIRVSPYDLIDSFSKLNASPEPTPGGIAGGGFGGFGFSSFGGNMQNTSKRFQDYNQYVSNVHQKLVAFQNGGVTNPGSEEAIEEVIEKAITFELPPKIDCFYFEQFLTPFPMVNGEKFSINGSVQHTPMCQRVKLLQLSDPKATCLEIASIDTLKGQTHDSLCNALEKSPNIKTLTVMGQITLKHVLQIFGACKHIENINFFAAVSREEEFNPKDYPLPNLRRFNFGKLGHSYDTGPKKKVLYSILSHCPRLETVILENEVTETVCEFIENTKSLKLFRLNGKSIYFFGCTFERFCEALGRNRSIRTLSFGETSSMRVSIIPFSSYEKINMAKSPEALTRLCASLIEIPTLESLIVRSQFENNPEGWTSLANFISSKKLKEIVLGSIWWPNRIEKAPAKVPNFKVSVDTLGLQGLPQNSISKILQFIQPKEVVLYGNNWTVEWLKSIHSSKVTFRGVGNLINMILAVNKNEEIHEICLHDCNVAIAPFISAISLLDREIPVHLKFTEEWIHSVKLSQTHYDTPTKYDQFPGHFLFYEDKRCGNSNKSVGYGWGQTAVDAEFWGIPDWIKTDNGKKIIQKLAHGINVSHKEFSDVASTSSI
jgi:hypothetical protein